jgi:hypothetical protein
MAETDRVPPPRPAPLGRLRRLAPALATLLLFAALAAFGSRWHWVEEAGSAERDGYVAQAEEILAGELPSDPYRPAFYPLATAALARCGVSPFTAARLLSEAAAALLAALAFLFARRLAGTPAGWLAFVATAVNPNLWILGQHVTTDVPFAALAAATLAAAFAYLEHPGWRPALATGVALGLAAFTRANAVFLLPALAVAWWLAPPAGRRLRHLAAAIATAFALFVPHLVLRAAVFGHPLHDENWKNLAFKLHGFPDWSYLDRVPYDGLLDVVLSDPGAVVAGFLSELWRFLAGGGLSQLVGTPLHALLLVAGAALALAAPATRRRAAWLLFAAATFLAAVAATFFAWGRLLLCLLPIANALAFAPWGREVRQGLRGGPRGRWIGPAFAAVAVAAVSLLAVKTAVFRLPEFVAHHPYAEVEVLCGLASKTPPGTVLAGTSPFLGRYLDRPYVYLEDAFGGEVDEPERWYAATRERLAAEGAAYLVVGAVDLRDRPPALMAPEPPVVWLEAAGGDDRVRVWRVVGVAPDPF